MENNSNYYQERRKHVRVNINISMNLVVFDTEASGVLTLKDLVSLRKGVMRDISLTGACIDTNDLEERWVRFLKLGTIQIALKFKLPNEEKDINASAKVMWIKRSSASYYKHTLGVQFVDMDENERMQIMQYIIEHKTKAQQENHP